MTEKDKKPEKQKAQAKAPVEKPQKQTDTFLESLVRIYGYDIPGSKNLYTGLTYIKGISWSVSNAICHKLNYPKTKKISELSKDEIKKIENFIQSLDVPSYLKNRRADPETGKTEHYYSSDLDMKREFDIKRLRNIKSYRGIRHALKLPVRGQRTRSHFRSKGVSMNIKKKGAK